MPRAALLFIVLAGCSAERPCSVVSVVLEDIVVHPLMYTGIRREIRWRIVTAGVCSATVSPLNRFTAEASGPDELPYPLEVSGPTYDATSARWMVSAALTPDRQGAYYMLVTFEPGGVSQFPLYAVGDARTVVPFAESIPAIECSAAQRTSRGGVICQERGGALHFYRGGGRLQSWDAGAHAAVDGDTLWLLTADGLLERRVDPGAGPLQELTTSVSGIPAGPMAAADSELVIGHYGSVSRFAVSDGGIVLAARASFPDAGLVTQVTYDAPTQTALVFTAAGWARTPLPDGLAQLSPEWTPAATLTGTATGRFWFFDERKVLTAIPADPSAPTARIGVGPLFPFAAPVGPAAGQRPFFGTPGEVNQAIVPRAVGSELQLTVFEAPLGYTFEGADARFLHASDTRDHALYFWPLLP